MWVPLSSNWLRQCLCVEGGGVLKDVVARTSWVMPHGAFHLHDPAGYSPDTDPELLVPDISSLENVHL